MSKKTRCRTTWAALSDWGGGGGGRTIYMPISTYPHQTFRSRVSGQEWLAARVLVYAPSHR